jgi:hypothetical protein
LIFFAVSDVTFDILIRFVPVAERLKIKERPHPNLREGMLHPHFAAGR